jgi:5'-3' exoribonuclease 1
MTSPTSPLTHFYPSDFESDLNGKKAEWEAVVKIPFIDQDLLVSAMKTREGKLTEEERTRNTFGTDWTFGYIDEDGNGNGNGNGQGEGQTKPYLYPSSLPGFFPAINNCRCVAKAYKPPEFPAPKEDLGYDANGRPKHKPRTLLPGVLLGPNQLAGFPSLHTVQFTVGIGVHGVNVHGSESRNRTIVLHVSSPDDVHQRKISEIGEELIGSRVFTGWPVLKEGLVSSISDGMFKYEKLSIVAGGKKKVISTPHSHNGMSLWRSRCERVESVYSKKFGVVLTPSGNNVGLDVTSGGIEILVHVAPLIGLTPTPSGALVKHYAPATATHQEVLVPYQLLIPERNIPKSAIDGRYVERPAPPLREEFKEGDRVFFLGEHCYGGAGQIREVNEEQGEGTLSVILAFYPSEKNELETFRKAVKDATHPPPNPHPETTNLNMYYPSYRAANLLAMSPLALSKITSSFMLLAPDNQKINVGLSIKFEAKALKVVGYSRKVATITPESNGFGHGHGAGPRGKSGSYWEFSERAVRLIREYREAFPELFDALESVGDGKLRSLFHPAIFFFFLLIVSLFYTQICANCVYRLPQPSPKQWTSCHKIQIQGSKKSKPG